MCKRLKPLPCHTSMLAPYLGALFSALKLQSVSAVVLNLLPLPTSFLYQGERGEEKKQATFGHLFSGPCPFAPPKTARKLALIFSPSSEPPDFFHSPPTCRRPNSVKGGWMRNPEALGSSKPPRTELGACWKRTRNPETNRLVSPENMPRPTKKKTIVFQSQFFRCYVCFMECVYLQSSIYLQRAFLGEEMGLAIFVWIFFNSHTDSKPTCVPIIDLRIYISYIYIYIWSLNIYIYIMSSTIVAQQTFKETFATTLVFPCLLQIILKKKHGFSPPGNFPVGFFASFSGNSEIPLTNTQVHPPTDQRRRSAIDRPPHLSPCPSIHPWQWQ